MIIPLIMVIVSCNSNQQENSLKEKELELKQKELELKQKEAAFDSVAKTRNEKGIDVSNKSKSSNKIPDAKNSSEVLNKSFVGKWTTSSDNSIKSYIIDLNGKVFNVSIIWTDSEDFKKEMASHQNILSNCANLTGKVINGVLVCKNDRGSSCDGETKMKLIKFK